MPGVKNPASSAAWIGSTRSTSAARVRAGRLARSGKRSSAAFSADWTDAGLSNLWSGEHAKQSVTAGGRATFTFTGTSVRWIGERGFGTGLARVSIDGQFIALVDTSTVIQEGYQAVLFQATGLASGTHTLTIDVVGRNNEPAGATVERVVIDAFDVY